MIETIPNLAEDEGFKYDASLHAKSVLKNRTLRVDELELQLTELLKNAYLRGGQAGFRIGLHIGSKHEK